MTGLDDIRQAAELMRQRAKIATPGPWEEFDTRGPNGTDLNIVGPADSDVEVCTLPATPQGSMDSWHIHAWTPEVAAEVADWLDEIYSAMTGEVIDGRATVGPVSASEYAAARRVARAYLVD